MSSTIAQLVVHCRDVPGQARFWSQVLGRPVDDGANADVAGIGVAEREAGRLAFLFLPAPAPAATANRLHLDLVHDERTTWRAEVNRVIALGAGLVAEREGFGWRWATLTDPEGNEFDLGVRAAVDR
ncbi:VOC family protein [Kineococcus sp. SYSU DK001]|uniref:VOC family protein n=1 Tax=Kineococcus sp. SYSU DK001 TaxID=3383122 RepID=UPI003D7DF191